MSSSILIGFDIGGTKSAVVVGDGSGQVLGRQQIPTGDPQPTMQQLIEIARGLLAGRRPAACGVSCGSPLSREKGMIQAPPNLSHWNDVPVRRMIQMAWDVPVNLENDADAGALAEWRWGLNCKVSDLAYLTCGTGQGSGLIIGGRLHRGASNMAGEIGHVRLLPLGPVGCRKAGSVEGLTSGRALGELAKLRLGEPHAPTVLDNMPPEQVNGKTVGEAALADDAFALAVVRELGDHLGHTCAILIDVLNPQRISLGSLAIRLGELLMEPVRRAAQREAMPQSYADCTIGPAVLGDKVQDLAALAAACQPIEAPM